MNILYISFLNGDPWAGPTYSVPKQIVAQSKLDNVFWYNVRRSKKNEWKKIPCYHDIDEFPECSVVSLPQPFNNPDLIIVEQFYGYILNRIMYELLFSNHKYIIIPRGELTSNAQGRRSLKKKIGNYLVFRWFAQKALAIQYLTEQEKNDSGEKWNQSAIVIPNGIDAPKKPKQNRSDNQIRCLSIGRIEPYHKGLDLLLEACQKLKEILKAHNCRIDLYGPDYDGKVDELRSFIDENGLQDIVIIHGPAYDEEKYTLLSESDVFVITSRFEGHPMAMIEALSYGLPCIATTGSNMRQEIEEYEAGWTADNTSTSICNAIEKMIAEKNSICKKGKNAVELSKKFDWVNIAQVTHETYKRMI